MRSAPQTNESRPGERTASASDSIGSLLRRLALRVGTREYCAHRLPDGRHAANVGADRDQNRWPQRRRAGVTGPSRSP